MLVVFVIGRVSPSLLGIAKRVKECKPSDYDAISTYLSFFDEIVFLPNTVSEASNLLDQLKGERRQDCMDLLAQLTKTGGKRYVPSADAADQPEYAALGITDAVILCTLGRDTYLLTADLALYLAALSRHCNAEHFANLR